MRGKEVELKLTEEEPSELLMSRVVDDQLPIEVEISLSSDDEAKLPGSIFVWNEDSREAMPARLVDDIG